MPNLRTCRKRASRLVERASPHVCCYIDLSYLFQYYWSLKYLGEWVTAFLGKFYFVRIIFKSFRARHLYNTNDNEIAPVRRNVHFPTWWHAALPTIIGRRAGSNGVSPRVHTERPFENSKTRSKLGPSWIFTWEWIAPVLNLCASIRIAINDNYNSYNNLATVILWNFVV